MSRSPVPGIRVALDLGEFFEDRRKKTYHYIALSRNKIVRDVYEDVRSVFCISADFVLEINGCFIPENEDIRVLRDEDVIKVINVGSCSESKLKLPIKHRKRKRSKDVAEDAAEIVSEALNSETQEENGSNELVVQCNGTFVKEGKAKTNRKAVLCPENSFHVQTHKLDPNLFASGIEDTLTEKDAVSDVEKKSISAEKRDVVLNKNDDVGEESESSKLKRKRRRRTKKSKTVDEGVENNCFVQPFVQPAIPMCNGHRSQKMNKHIKFSDDDDLNNISIEDNNLNDKCNGNSNELLSGYSLLTPQTELASVKQENRNCVKNENNTPVLPKVLVASTSSIFRNSSKSICNNLVSEKPSSPMIFECKRTNRSASNQNIQKENEPDFTKYPILNSQPRANDIIVFKKLKMDANYCPTMSGNITSKVLQVSENDGTVTLRILNGLQEFKEPQGKFSLEQQEDDDGNGNGDAADADAAADEKPKEIIVEDVEMNICDLLDVRLLFP